MAAALVNVASPSVTPHTLFGVGAVLARNRTSGMSLVGQDIRQRPLGSSLAGPTPGRCLRPWEPGAPSVGRNPTE